MKNLIYVSDNKNKNFFNLCDEMTNAKGQSCNKSDYIISKDNMPHKYFSDNIVIYGRSTCPYCQDAIKHLKSKQKYSDKIIFIQIDTEPTKYLKKINLLEILKSEIGNHNTVPITFYKGKFIGGCDETKQYFT
jgi:glutaredoxin